MLLLFWDDLQKELTMEITWNAVWWAGVCPAAAPVIFPLRSILQQQDDGPVSLSCCWKREERQQIYLEGDWNKCETHTQISEWKRNLTSHPLCPEFERSLQMSVICQQSKKNFWKCFYFSLSKTMSLYGPVNPFTQVKPLWTLWCLLCLSFRSLTLTRLKPSSDSCYWKALKVPLSFRMSSSSLCSRLSLFSKKSPENANVLVLRDKCKNNNQWKQSRGAS